MITWVMLVFSLTVVFQINMLTAFLGYSWGNFGKWLVIYKLKWRVEVAIQSHNGT